MGVLAGSLAAQTSLEEYRVYNQHPRLLLTAQRLRLLKRERDRDSMRWHQFSLLVRSASEMPEPGFALALYYQVTNDEAFGKRAAEWALGPGSDVRQLALVYDWCQPVLSPQQSKTLAAKIQRLSEQRPADSLLGRRDRVVAVIATADENQHGEEAFLRDTVDQWWRAKFAPSLADGRTVVPLDELYALAELLHAIRDNLKIELRDDIPEYFRDLPKYQVLGNYPAPLQAPENEYRIPVFTGSGEPDLNKAALARVAGLTMVAYDNNALENQFLQGWLIQDRFMLQGTFGAPYEFLWANPYQPGLSYFQLPVLYHDPRSGALFVRSNWEDDAVWFGLYGGEAQLFRDGKITVLKQPPPGAPSPKPVAVGDASVMWGTAPLRFSVEGGTILIVGLKPQRKYLVETDDEELQEAGTDRNGTLVLPYSADRNAGVRIYESQFEVNGGTTESGKSSAVPNGKP
ncbi:MAG TPA: hypothetical protein VKX49_16870 [Bryobacteraceae bacterium]|nr:hypothetical protein [Bryobacteraceae bacterium]